MGQLGNRQTTQARSVSFWMVGAMLWLGGIAGMPDAAAQQPAAPPEDAAPLQSHAAILSAPAYISLQTAWREVQTDLKREAWVEATGRLSYLVDLRTDLGLANLPEFASVLMHAADDAAAKGAADSATSLAQAAAVLAPDLVSPQLAVARHQFDKSPLGLTDTIRSMRGASERLETDLGSHISLLGNSAAIWIDVVIILSLLFALALYTRYNRYAASDIRRLLPKGVTLIQAEVLLLALLVTPFAAGLGLLVTVTIWLVVFGSYLRPTERLAVLLTVIAIASVPASTRTVVRSLTYAAEPASVLHRCNTGLCGPDDRALIRQWANDEVRPYQSYFTTALVLARDAGVKGDTDSYELSKRYAQTAHEVRETPESYTLLGNLAYMRGLRNCPALKEGAAGANDRIQRAQRDAVDYWNKALSLSSGYVPALYNSSVALTQLGDHVEADPLLERAMRFDYDLVLRWNKTISRDGANLVPCKMGVFANRQIMLPSLPQRDLRRSVKIASVPSDGLVIPFSGIITGRLGTNFIGLFGLGGAVALILMWLFAKMLRPTVPCTVCDKPAVPGTRLETQDGPVCAGCVEDDVRRAFVDAKKQWVREQQLEVAVTRRAQRARLLTWLLPGFGHMLRGRAIRGLIFFGIVVSCLVAGTDIHSLVDDPYAPLGSSSARMVAFGIPAGLAYLLAIIDAHAGGTSS